MKKKEKDGEVWRALALFTQLGFSMAACVFIGVVAGKLLDSWLDTTPWLLILFSIIGGVAAFKVLYDMAIKGFKK